MRYDNYIRSPEWKKRRDTYVNGRTDCENCGEHRPLDVHHLTYDSLGFELDEHLIALCRPCHGTMHGRSPRRRNRRQRKPYSRKIRAARRAGVVA